MMQDSMPMMHDMKGGGMRQNMTGGVVESYDIKPNFVIGLSNPSLKSGSVHLLFQKKKVITVQEHAVPSRHPRPTRKPPDY